MLEPGSCLHVAREEVGYSRDPRATDPLQPRPCRPALGRLGWRCVRASRASRSEADQRIGPVWPSRRRCRSSRPRRAKRSASAYDCRPLHPIPMPCRAGARRSARRGLACFHSLGPRSSALGSDTARGHPGPAETAPSHSVLTRPAADPSALFCAPMQRLLVSVSMEPFRAFSCESFAGAPPPVGGPGRPLASSSRLIGPAVACPRRA